MMVDEGAEIQYWADNSKDRVAKFQELLPKYVDIVVKPKNTNNAYYMKNGVKIYDLASGAQGSVSKCNLKSNYSNGGDGGQDDTRGSYFGACGKFYIDINGEKKPNQEGVDRFGFFIVSDGIVPMGHPKENIHNTVFDASNVDSRVTAWVIYNKNMDYLHCPEKLGWDKAQSCK